MKIYGPFNALLVSREKQSKAKKANLLHMLIVLASLNNCAHIYACIFQSLFQATVRQKIKYKRQCCQLFTVLFFSAAAKTEIIFT